MPDGGLTNIYRRITSTRRYSSVHNFPLGSLHLYSIDPLPSLTHSYAFINPFIGPLSHIFNKCLSTPHCVLRGTSYEPETVISFPSPTVKCAQLSFYV